MVSVKKPSVPVLQATIAEQQRVYDELVESKRQVNIKTLTLGGAGLALFTYLYTGGDLFIPDEIYGRILYVIGAVLALGAEGVLLFAIKPSGRWELPTESEHKLKNLSETSERDYLEYIKDRYIYCFKHNSKHYSKKQRLMNLSFFPLVFGAIILVAIKVLEGALWTV